jgi:hypothetical protein
MGSPPSASDTALEISAVLYYNGQSTGLTLAGGTDSTAALTSRPPSSPVQVTPARQKTRDDLSRHRLDRRERDPTGTRSA